MHNPGRGGQGTPAYEPIRRVAETGHDFHLNTRAGQLTRVFKDLLTPEQKRSFPLFLREKRPNIKVVR